MIVCPHCGSIASLNSYFGAYICEKCNWKDDSLNKTRNQFIEKENIWLVLDRIEYLKPKQKDENLIEKSF